jgi:DNA mismatch repair protein MutL
MSDIIQLLPDHVASQIAAGEVIQRPASALKEMLENSVDAGATSIQVILKDAGKALIQVIDNGCGMSMNDARMCFERHATSKIKSAEDLSYIRTMGFRGEALASIAAIAQVELKTKLHEEETGTLLVIEGSELKKQEQVACNNGTSLAVRNLFFNVPARRNFLKSNAAETRHLIDEFERQALAHPEIAYRLQQDGHEIHQLTAGSLKQRIIQLYGNQYSERLVPVEEQTTALGISGFVVKPEFCRKTRGEQFFFVNKRFIKDGYLHHAVAGAFAELLPRDTYPSYFIHLTIDPASIDVNIHPTKTEIKFQDERLVYSILKSAVKRALGKFSIMPSLDFEQEASFQLPPSKFKELPKVPVIKINPAYNPFHAEQKEATPVKEWIRFHEETAALGKKLTIEQPEQTIQKNLLNEKPAFSFLTVFGRFLLFESNESLYCMDVYAAYVRIHYEKLMAETLQQHRSQQSLFPKVMEFNPGDFVMLKEISHELKKFGFDIAEFGKNTFVINGIPPGFEETDIRAVLDQLLDDLKQNVPELKTNLLNHLARRLAHARARKSPFPKNKEEAEQLLEQLFKTENPNHTPGGRIIMVSFTQEEILRKFRTPSRL